DLPEVVRELGVGEPQFAAPQRRTEQQFAGGCVEVTGVNENGDAVHGRPGKLPLLKPLSHRERGWGEGTCSRKAGIVATWLHARSRTLTRRYAPPSPEGRGEEALIRSPGTNEAVRCAKDAAACAAPWPLSGGCARG